MRNPNLAPFWRSSVGFDRLFDLMDEALRFEPEDNYPPYNIIRTGEDKYRISLAVAGFDPQDISVTAQQNLVTVTARKPQTENRDFLYHGISGRPFERRFSIADHVRVTAASFENGLLHIDLVRELPEAMKPKRIEIRTGNVVDLPTQAKTLDHKAA